MANVRDLSPEDKEAFHQAAEARIKTFRYAPPAQPEAVKDIVTLCKSDLVKVNVQIVQEGGENNLHYHLNSDTCWMVLRGRAKFYGPADALLGEFGAHDGILLPGGARYWFEKIGDETLEILQMVAIDKAKGQSQRVNIERHKEWMTESALQVYEQS
jgi:mannose-6-phosphate isomerase-like protein (cupin superfamily)